MADSTITPVGGGGSIFAPPPISPQPIGKINNGAVVSAAANSKNNGSTPTDTLSISDLAKSLAAASKTTTKSKGV